LDEFTKNLGKFPELFGWCAKIRAQILLHGNLQCFLFMWHEQCVNLRSKEMIATTRLVLTRIIR